MLITILTARQHRVLELQQLFLWSKPIKREEAEAIAQAETFAYTHVAVCAGIQPIYATVGERVMVIRYAYNNEEQEETIDISDERDALQKFSTRAPEIAKSVLFKTPRPRIP